jgi:hypothetical protein
MEESAYAHLGNAEMILGLILAELPPDTQAVTVATVELQAVLLRITKARAVIHRFAMQATGGVHV